MKSVSSQYFILILIIGFLSACNSSQKNPSNTSDSLAFGDSKFLSEAFKGNLYFIKPGSSSIPEFDTMQSQATIYTDSIDIPERSWNTGFPGLPSRFEWFGIEYTSHFKAFKPGHYIFRLLSDDGSKLFIDDSLIINNDGMHAAWSKTGEISLDTNEHSIKLQYFQGPKYSIALQFFVSTNDKDEEIFPGKLFKLTTDKASPKNNYYLLLLILIALIITGYWVYKKSRKNNKAAT